MPYNYLVLNLASVLRPNTWNLQKNSVRIFKTLLKRQIKESNSPRTPLCRFGYYEVQDKSDTENEYTCKKILW